MENKDHKILALKYRPKSFDWSVKQLGKYFYYKDQINFDKFYKEYLNGSLENMQFDIENEYVILYYDNEGQLNWSNNHNVILMTSCITTKPTKNTK